MLVKKTSVYIFKASCSVAITNLKKEGRRRKERLREEDRDY